MVDDSFCGKLKKPESISKCKLSECPNANVVPRNYFDRKENDGGRYRWRTGPWKKVIIRVLTEQRT